MWIGAVRISAVRLMGCIFIGAFACYRMGDGHFRDVPQVAFCLHC
jgi:hypothetical protein